MDFRRDFPFLNDLRAPGKVSRKVDLLPGPRQLLGQDARFPSAQFIHQRLRLLHVFCAGKLFQDHIAGFWFHLSVLVEFQDSPFHSAGIIT